MSTFIIDQDIELEALPLQLPSRIELSERAKIRIQRNRDFLERKLVEGKVHYGINTGFGSLCNVVVSSDELGQLQENLVMSHACGMGEELPVDLVKWMMLLKVKGMSEGHSGVRLALVEQLCALYNFEIIPVVYSQGSLGASGDLAPLAHMSLALLGMGEVYFQGQKIKAMDALSACQLRPIQLMAKEGLALLNGTQFMSAHALWAYQKSQLLIEWADAIAALSGDAYGIKMDPFQEPIHRVRPHEGQLHTARIIRAYLDNSPLQAQHKDQVQDPYSFRCVPQVHGATKDTLAHFKKILLTEINAVTDNPLVFEEEDLILSGGNFHGQALALILDFLAIAMSELANISERRIYLLVSGQRDLPPFLAPQAGLNSGFMIAQYTAASIVSQNKQFCTPASVDSIVSSNGQEDHVSMGANAATKLLKVIDNVQSVLGIEYLCAAQALDCRAPIKSSIQLEKIKQHLRNAIPAMNEDRLLHADLVKAKSLISLPIKQLID